MASPYPAQLTPPGSCVFCTIIEEGSELVHRGDSVAAFLDIRPLFPGHLLITPTSHVLTLDQLPAAELGALMALTQRAVAAMKAALGAEGAFVANNNIVSQSVPHLHVHVVPRTKGDGLRGFFWPRTDYDDPDHKAEIAGVLATALAEP